MFEPGVPTRSPATEMYYPHILAGFGVRSRVAFLSPFIVLHGSTGFCLLFRKSKILVLGPEAPLASRTSLSRTCWPELSAASWRELSTTGSVEQGQDRRASDESLDDKLSLPLVLSLVLCGRLCGQKDQQDERDARG